MNASAVKQAISAVIGEIREIPRLYPFRRPAVIALAAAIAAIAALHGSGRLDAGKPWEVYEGERCAIVGVVRSQPDLRPTGVVYEVDAETIQPTEDRLSAARGRLLVHVLNSTASVAETGDRIRAFGRISRPATARTPGSFDYRAFLRARSIGAIAYAGPNGFENLGRAAGFSARRLGGRIERRVAECFSRRLEPEAAAVLAGLTVGERPRFYPDVRRAFVESGTMHVLVASGSNVGFIVAALCLLAAALRVPIETAIAGSLPLVWLYVLVVGGDAPIARAGVMATLFAGARLLGREDRAFHALAVAALAMAIADPASIFDVGLQMSFLTVFGFLFHLPHLERRIESLPRWTRWPLRALAASVIAQLWLLPISAAVFHRLYPISLIANLVIVPAASAGLGVGFILAILDSAGWAVAADATARLAGAYATALLGVARFFADHSGGSIWLATPRAAQIAGFLAAALAAPYARRSILAGSAFALGVAALFFLRPASVAETTTWGIAWLDTGTRTTAVLLNEKREAVVINPGPAAPANSSERILAPFFSEAGVDRVAAVIVSDPRVTTDDVTAVARLIPVARVIPATATACLFGPWDPHGAPSPHAFQVAGFEIAALPSPPYAGERPLWISRDGHAALLGHRLELETQGAALEREGRPDVVQGRFRPEAVWSPAFRRRFRPAVLVDTAGSSRTASAPWDRDIQRPQEKGWLWWESGLRTEGSPSDPRRRGAAPTRAAAPRNTPTKMRPTRT